MIVYRISLSLYSNHIILFRSEFVLIYLIDIDGFKVK